MRRALLALCLALPLLAAPAAAHETDGRGTPIDRGAIRAALQGAEPPVLASPRARCGPGSRPETGMQGRVPPGAPADGFTCNLTQIGHIGESGGFKVHRYVDRAGHECAYYDTTLLFPTNVVNLSSAPTGTAVLDMSDPTKPVRTATLITPAMQTPHESLVLNERRGLLAAVTGNALAYPGIVDVYDVGADCRHPELLSSLPVGVLGHESGFAPDGRTFYATSLSTGHVTAVDLTDPRLPRILWVGEYRSHGLTLSEDGNRAYVAASQGLIILDTSEVQARRPDPQVREVSRLSWSNLTIPQVAIPVTIGGRPFLVEIDEFSGSETSNGPESNGSRVGAGRIIDIADERRPRTISNFRLEVHQPENRAQLADDPGASSFVQGYAGHYCNVPRAQDPGIVACGFIASGLRVFDIRDPYGPKELAYFVAPPATGSSPGEPSNYAMSSPDFAPERREIWYSDGNSGFYALRMREGVWPFAGEAGGRARCVGSPGFGSVATVPVGRGVRMRFTRRVDLPVRVDVFRVSRARRVLREHLVARFGGRTRSFTWNGVPNRGEDPLGPGDYFVRFTMGRGGGRYDVRRLVLRRGANGRFVRRPGHYRRATCSVLRKFKLERPVFGGRQRRPLRASYRLTSRARVTVTVLRGRRVVRRFGPAERRAWRTYRLALSARGLPAGDYRVRLEAVGPNGRLTATVVARRIG